MKKGHNWGLCRVCGKIHIHGMLGKPRSNETKEKISVGNKGKIVSKETRMKISNALRGEKSPLYGKHPTEETKLKLSKKTKEEWINGVHDGNSEKMRETSNALWASGRYTEVSFGRGVNGKRADLNNQFFRSTWEANVARILNFWGIKWEYEVKRIPYNNGTKSHMIDFYLPETDSFLEVFGYLDKRHLEELYGAYESGLRVQLIGPDIYRDLEKNFKDKLPFWENGRKKTKTLNT